MGSSLRMGQALRPVSDLATRPTLAGSPPAGYRVLPLPDARIILTFIDGTGDRGDSAKGCLGSVRPLLQPRS